MAQALCDRVEIPVYPVRPDSRPWLCFHGCAAPVGAEIQGRLAAATPTNFSPDGLEGSTSAGHEEHPSRPEDHAPSSFKVVRFGGINHPQTAAGPPDGVDYSSLLALVAGISASIPRNPEVILDPSWLVGQGFTGLRSVSPYPITPLSMRCYAQDPFTSRIPCAAAAAGFQSGPGRNTSLPAGAGDEESHSACPHLRLARSLPPRGWQIWRPIRGGFAYALPTQALVFRLSCWEVFEIRIGRPKVVVWTTRPGAASWLPA